MDTVEELVARRLDALASDRRPVPDVLERALRSAERRRRRRRGAAVVAGTAGTLALVVGVATFGVGSGRETPVDLPAPVPLSTVALDPALADLLGTPTARVLPREHGWYDFRAYALAADGTLFGAEQHYDRSWFDTWGRGRTADLESGRMESYEVETGAPFTAGDGQTRLTLEHLEPGHKFDLVCTPRVGGARAQLSDGSVVESSVRLDAGHVVWSTYPAGDEPYRTWTAQGCAGTPRALQVPGLVRAVSWPDVYLSTADEDRLVRVDASTGEREDLAVPGGLSARDLPGPPGARDHVAVDAAGDVVAWTVDGRLVVLETTSGRAEVVATDLPLVSGSNGSQVRVGVGDRFVSWASSPVDGDPATSQGLLVEIGTGRTAALDGEVWTRGPWVTWLAQDGYRVVRTG